MLKLIIHNFSLSDFNNLNKNLLKYKIFFSR